MKSCIFCQIVEYQVPAYMIYEDDIVMAFLDKDPISDGHILIIPKKHFNDLHALDSETAQRVMEVTKKLAGALEKEFKFDGSMIMEVNGAFQVVPHFHLHVFGRNKDNDIQFVYPKGIHSKKDHLYLNAERLKRATFK